MTSGQSRREFLKSLGSAGALMLIGADGVLAYSGMGESTPRVGKIEFKYRTLSVDHLSKLRRDFEKIESSSLISDHEVFRSYISEFKFGPPEGFAEARSIILVALPDMITEIDFHFNGTKHRVIIPPGYVDTGMKLDNLKAQIAREIVGSEGARLEKAALPLKLLASRCGLGQYGKNNICFVNGYGSFHALLAFYSDHSFGEDNWTNVRVLRECRGCTICIKECPTRCIDEEKFVIDAGRCIPLYNERPDPMPGWLDPAVHHTLVGCAKCQITCPVNASVINQRRFMADVTEDETRMLVEGTQNEDLKSSIEGKLARCGLVGDLAHLGRNLRLVLDARG